MEEINKRQEVYEVFKEYFGEDRVDFQIGGKLIVYFPTVTVANEKNESIVITDLYVKILVSCEGLIEGNPEMTRGSYTLSQIHHNYLHSHALEIPQENCWSSICLGTGPITHTISILSLDCDLERWELFCFELEKYVAVESIEGVPYHRLREVSRSSFIPKTINLTYEIVHTRLFPSVLEPFLPYLIDKNVLRFTQIGNHWYIAQSFIEYISTLTSALKDYIIEQGLNPDVFIREKILIKGLYKDGHFITRTKTFESLNSSDIEGKIACVFKGNIIRVTVIYDIVDQDDSKDLIVVPDLANQILYKILNVLNYGSVTRNEAPSAQEGTIIL